MSKDVGEELALVEFSKTDIAIACATSEGAYANCLAISAIYAKWLREQDVCAGLLMMKKSRSAFPLAAGRWPHLDHEKFAHWVVICGDLSVDWSARQFDPTAPWPLVRPITSLTDDWEEVVMWACKDCPELLTHPQHGTLAPVDMHIDHERLARLRGEGVFFDPRHEDDHGPLIPLCDCHL